MPVTLTGEFMVSSKKGARTRGNADRPHISFPGAARLC